MTDTRAVQKSPVSENRDGYVTVSVTLAGHSYDFNFYKGFVRRLTLQRAESEVIEVYEQDGVYHVPQPPHQKKGPDPISTVRILGGPNALDIELRVEDTPQDERYRGPIESIRLWTGRGEGGAGEQGPSVRATRGGNQIAKLEVRTRPGRGVPNSPTSRDDSEQGGGDVIEIENSASTCPPTCDPD